MVAQCGTTSDQFEFLTVALDSVNRVLYCFNVDDQMLSATEKLFTELVSNLEPNDPAVRQAFHRVRTETLPQFERSIDSWLTK